MEVRLIFVGILVIGLMIFVGLIVVATIINWLLKMATKE